MSSILTKQPKDYQKDILNQVISTDASTLIQLPTGSGKTFIAKLIALELTSKDQRVLFVTPQENLMEQTMEEFKSLRPQKVHGAAKYDPQHLISVSTNQTAKNRKDLKPDVIIVDEIHYGYTGKMLAELKDANPNSRIIGLSATPYDQDGVLLKGFEIILDDYDVKYMIENGYLVDIETYAAVPRNLFHKLDNIRIVAGDYDKQALVKLMGDPTAVLEVVNATKDHINKSKKTIIFAVNIKHANLLTEAYKKAGFSCEVLHSETKKQNDEIVSRFKKGYVKVLVSVNMLTTGFDVPDTDMAVIARPTKSQNLYKQMVGRIMRLAPDKTHAILLDCGGVVRNLGYPTDPIQERLKSGRAVGKHLCSFCGSQRLHPKHINEKIYWVCSECGGKKEAKEARIYRCESCNTYSGRNANLYMDDKALTLICQCGHHTVISTPHCNEVLTQVIDPKRKIEIITNRVIREYKELIEKYFGNKELNSYEIKNHIRDIEYKIKRDPDDFLELDLETVINKNNRFIPFVKDEKDAFLKNIPIMGEEIGKSLDKLTLSTTNTLKFISHKYKESVDLKSTHFEIKKTFTCDDTYKSNMMNPIRKANDAILELFTDKLWQDGFVYLSIENLLAVARMTKILEYADKIFLEKEMIQEKQFLKNFHESIEINFKNIHLGVLANTTSKMNKVISKKIKNDLDLIFDFNEAIEANIRQIAKALKIADDDIDDLFEIIVYSMQTTTQLSTSVNHEMKTVERKIFESRYPKISKLVYLEVRLIKNPDVKMKFINLAIETYQSNNTQMIFEEIEKIIETETKNAKIKNVHKEILLQLNKQAFEVKKFDLWHDSFFYLSYENFEGILGVFTLLGDNLKKSINSYFLENNEIDAKALALHMRSELHYTESNSFDIWKQKHPQEKKENLLKNSKKFKQFFNETIRNKIADFEKILS